MVQRPTDVSRSPNIMPVTAPKPEAASASGPAATSPGDKPRVLMLVDRPGWAFDTLAQAISRRLSDEFEFRIEYVWLKPDLSQWDFDLLYVFFWGETYHQRFVKDPRRIIKEISSHRWANEDRYGCLTAAQAAEKYLSDAGTLAAPSRRLQAIFGPFREVLLIQHGFEPGEFMVRHPRNGKLRIGWAGNKDDQCKGLHDILRPAAGSDFKLRVAGGNLGRHEMMEFYNSVDVICVASTAEGTPFPLVEGMACGCFPVAVDVGVVPELVRHRVNGLIVNRHPAAFQAAFQWCALNTDRVREAGLCNAEEMLHTRTWDQVSLLWREVLRHAYRQLPGHPSSPTINTEAHPPISNPQ